MHEKVNNFSISYQRKKHTLNCNLSWKRQQEFQIHLIRETVTLYRHIFAVRNCPSNIVRRMLAPRACQIFATILKSPLVRKRPRNSELRNKLKFSKDNYRLRVVFKLNPISTRYRLLCEHLLKTIISADIELENGEPDYLFKKEVESQTTLCASVRWVFKLVLHSVVHTTSMAGKNAPLYQYQFEDLSKSRRLS